MTTKRAKVLNNEELNRVLEYVAEESSRALRDYVVILLSFKAGLRVGEIAGLDWADVTNAFGEVRRDAFFVPSDIAKKGSTRTVPMHPALYAALSVWHKQVSKSGKVSGQWPVLPAIHTKDRRVSTNTLTQYILRLFERLGLEGCSSHSGRRSFITTAARLANKHGCSLKDVQRMAGHRNIDTTEIYIEPSDMIGELVRAI